MASRSTLRLIGTRKVFRLGRAAVRRALAQDDISTIFLSSRALLCDLFQFRYHSLYFFQGVVVHQADAQPAATRFHVKPPRQVEGEVMAVPGEDAALTQLARQLDGRVPFHANGDRGRALAKSRGIGDAV